MDTQPIKSPENKSVEPKPPTAAKPTHLERTDIYALRAGDERWFFRPDLNEIEFGLTLDGQDRVYSADRTELDGLLAGTHKNLMLNDAESGTEQTHTANELFAQHGQELRALYTRLQAIGTIRSFVQQDQLLLPEDQLYLPVAHTTRQSLNRMSSMKNGRDRAVLESYTLDEPYQLEETEMMYMKLSDMRIYLRFANLMAKSARPEMLLAKDLPLYQRMAHNNGSFTLDLLPAETKSFVQNLDFTKHTVIGFEQVLDFRDAFKKEYQHLVNERKKGISETSKQPPTLGYKERLNHWLTKGEELADLKKPRLVISKAVSRIFHKVKLANEGRSTKPHVEATNRLQQLIVDNTLKLVGANIQVLKQRLDKWWEFVLTLGSPDLSRGTGLWVALHELGDGFDHIKHTYETQLPNNELHAHQQFAEQFITGLIFGAHKIILRTDPEAFQRSADYLRKQSGGMYQPYAILWHANIPYVIHLPNPSQADSAEGIEYQVRQILHPDRKKEPTDKESGIEVKAIMASLNALPKDQQNSYLANQIKDQKVLQQIKNSLAYIEHAQFSVSLGPTPNKEEPLNTLTAGICEQKVQFHIQTPADDPLNWREHLPIIYAVNPHWEFDVAPSLVFTHELFPRIASYLNNKLPSLTIRPALLQRIEPRPVVFEAREAQEILQFMKKSPIKWNPHRTADKYTAFRYNHTPLTSASYGLDRQIHYTLQRFVDGKTRELWLTATQAMLKKLNAPEEWIQNVDARIDKDTLNTVTSPFVMTTIAQLYAATLVAEHHPQSEITPAVTTPVLRDDLEDIIEPNDAKKHKRLGVATHAISRETYLSLKDLMSYARVTDVLPKSRDTRNNAEAAYDIAGELRRKLEKPASGTLSFRDLLMEEVRDIRQEVLRARDGLSSTMILAAAGGFGIQQKVLQGSTDLIGARDARLTITDASQLSYMTETITETVGITKDTAGRILTTMRGFFGARSKQTSKSHVTAITENGMTSVATTRIPRRLFTDVPEFGRVYDAALKDALALMSVVSLSDTQLDVLMEEFVHWTDSRLPLPTSLVPPAQNQDNTLMTFLKERMKFEEIGIG